MFSSTSFRFYKFSYFSYTLLLSMCSVFWIENMVDCDVSQHLIIIFFYIFLSKLVEQNTLKVMILRVFWNSYVISDWLNNYFWLSSMFCFCFSLVIISRHWVMRVWYIKWFIKICLFFFCGFYEHIFAAFYELIMCQCQQIVIDIICLVYPFKLYIGTVPRKYVST